MPQLKIVEVTEKELEQLLVDDPACIEDGMQVLDRQVPTDSGPLDILASDTYNVLSVIELKVVVDEGQLAQGLRYYDWARTNLEGIARLYSDKVKVDVDQEPALILIAPGFSQNIIRIAKYIEIPLKLKQYRALQLPHGGREVVCTSVDVPEKRGPPRIPTTEGNPGNIKTEDVRALCETAMEQLRAIGVELRPKQNYWFSCWYGGRSFMWLGCKRQFFVVEVQGADGRSERKRVHTQVEWDDVMQRDILPVCTPTVETDASSDSGQRAHEATPSR
jgi:hypothetical protein